MQWQKFIQEHQRAFQLSHHIATAFIGIMLAVMTLSIAHAVLIWVFNIGALAG